MKQLKDSDMFLFFGLESSQIETSKALKKIIFRIKIVAVMDMTKTFIGQFIKISFLKGESCQKNMNPVMNNNYDTSLAFLR